MTDSATEELDFSVAEAQAPDMSRAVLARPPQAFDQGPWPRMTHAERADLPAGPRRGPARTRTEDIGQIWPRESGVLHFAVAAAPPGSAAIFDYYAALADTYLFEEPAQPTAGGEFGLLVREPVGVVGAIIPWNGPHEPYHLQGRARR